MDDEKALALQEKYYFHELESREKLTARLQLTLAMLVALISLVAYLILHVHLDFLHSPAVGGIFSVTFALGSALLIASSYFFVHALWGQSYECLPMPAQVEAYRQQLRETYQTFADGEETAAAHFRQFLIRYYADCATHNAIRNANRYVRLHDATSNLIYSIPPLLIAALAVQLGGLTT